MTRKKSNFKITSVRLLSALFIFFAIVSCGPVNNNNTNQVSTEPAVLELPQQPVTAGDDEQPSSEMLETVQEPASELLQILEEQSSEETQTTNSQVALNPPHGEPGHTCDLPVGAPLNSAPAATTTNGTGVTNSQVALNPPHGEPGHTCDLPVGAPLNSAPATTTTGTAATTSQIAYNPPHGEPGHTCDLPVGAPLNSATAAAQTTQAPASVMQSVINSGTQVGPTRQKLEQLNSPRPVSLAVPELNPPHGQPFHRCDIPVGAPLSS